MKSILENRPELAYEVNQAAEVAGYLWQKGWAERNGGNITLNITEYVDDEIRALPAISEVKQIGKVLPYLKGCYFYCKGTQTVSYTHLSSYTISMVTVRLRWRLKQQALTM